MTSNSSSSSGGVSTHQFKSGQTVVQIRNNELFVNDTNYGKLNPGEPVLIDNGKVFVAGQPRPASN